MSLVKAQHKDMIVLVILVFKRSTDIVVAIVGENLEANQSLDSSTGTGFIGCASHRFNIGMREIIDENREIFNCVHSLMEKIRNRIQSARRRKLTMLKQLLGNLARWSSTYAMISL